MRSFVIVADDIGLSRGITYTILQAADAGMLQGVSILTNGEALAYTCSELLKRPSLLLALHCNLTEGKSLSAPQSVPLLVDANGFFKYSVLTLWASYIFSSPSRRVTLCAQVGKELSMQLAALKRQGVVITRADGHQHVHMLPFVFDALIALPGISRIRIPREPLYIGPEILTFCKRVLSAIVLRLLCWCALCVAHTRGIAHNDYALGVLYSGRMSAAVLATGIASLPIGADEVEVIVHPGSAREGELKEWRASGADISWHFSPGRGKERQLLESGLSQILSYEFRKSTKGNMLRFIISGLIAAVVNFTSLWLFTSVLGLWYIYSAVLAFICAFGVGFSLQKFWTFQDKKRESIPKQASLYMATAVVNLGINVIALYLLVQIAGLWYMFAQVLITAVIATWSFLLYRFIIFKTSL